MLCSHRIVWASTDVYRCNTNVSRRDCRILNETTIWAHLASVRDACRRYVRPGLRIVPVPTSDPPETCIGLKVSNEDSRVHHSTHHELSRRYKSLGHTTNTTIARGPVGLLARTSQQRSSATARVQCTRPRWPHERIPKRLRGAKWL